MVFPTRKWEKIVHQQQHQLSIGVRHPLSLFEVYILSGPQVVMVRRGDFQILLGDILNYRYVVPYVIRVTIYGDFQIVLVLAVLICFINFSVSTCFSWN